MNCAPLDARYREPYILSPERRLGPMSRAIGDGLDYSRDMDAGLRWRDDVTTSVFEEARTVVWGRGSRRQQRRTSLHWKPNRPV